MLTSGSNRKRYIAGPCEPRHDRLGYDKGDHKASWLFLSLLRARLEANEDAQTIYLSLDNYVIHESALTKAWLAEFGDCIRLHSLPSYCPNENRIERVSLDLHANVTRSHCKRTIRALLEPVHCHLAARLETERRILLVARC